MQNLIGKIVFKICKKLLSIFGFVINLGANSSLYPELNPDEMNFLRSVFNKHLTMTSFESLCTLAITCKHISKSNISGSFVEAGVWRGGSSIVAKKFLKGEREFFLYDTFAGMTEPSIHDFRVGGSNYSSSLEKWKSGQAENHNDWVFASLEEVQKNFDGFGLLDDSIVFHKGDVREALNEMQLPWEIVLLRLDTDFYDSTLIELQTLYPKLAKGGILILDDYGHWDGARLAVDEFFSAQTNATPLMIPIAGGGGRLIIKQ
jgi:hypothetical protein